MAAASSETVALGSRVDGGSGTFWMYAVICVGIFLFVRACLPETKGKTLEQIERELVD